jgi:hypothetical protein
MEYYYTTEIEYSEMEYYYTLLEYYYPTEMELYIQITTYRNGIVRNCTSRIIKRRHYPKRILELDMSPRPGKERL